MHYLLIDSYTDAMPVQNVYRCLALIASDFTKTIADFTKTIADFTNTISKPDNHKLSTL